jgi:hypothetical protein
MPEPRDEPLAEDGDVKALLSGEVAPQAALSIRTRIGSGAISTAIPQAAQASASRLEASSSAGSVHHGHSKVII